MITLSMAREGKCGIRPYIGPAHTWGTTAPVYYHGVTDVLLRHNCWSGSRRLGNFLVVDDSALPADQPILLGVEAIRTLRAIPDLDAGRIYFKRQADSGITALTPSAPLHTGHLQAQPANQTFVIMSRGLVQLPPNSTDYGPLLS